MWENDNLTYACLYKLIPNSTNGPTTANCRVCNSEGKKSRSLYVVLYVWMQWKHLQIEILVVHPQDKKTNWNSGRSSTKTKKKFCVDIYIYVSVKHTTSNCLAYIHQKKGLLIYSSKKQTKLINVCFYVHMNSMKATATSNYRVYAKIQKGNSVFTFLYIHI